MDDFAGSNRNGPAEDGTVKDKRVEFAVFAAGIGAGRKIEEKGIVEFAADETGSENFGIDAGGDGAETLFVEKADELARVALPDGKEGGHRSEDTRLNSSHVEISYAVFCLKKKKKKINYQ